MNQQQVGNMNEAITRNIINVNIGEVIIGNESDHLKTILGSCLGIAFIWKEHKSFGLAHCLLPQAPHASSIMGARFVDQALTSLIKMMKIRPEDFKNIEVILSGGGHPLSNAALANSKFNVGAQNLDTARKLLASYGFKYKEMDVGCNTGLQMSLDCSSGIVLTKRLRASC